MFSNQTAGTVVYIPPINISPEHRCDISIYSTAAAPPAGE